MRNVLFKALRETASGRFAIGKNKVMAIALGIEESSECVTGAAQLARALRGNLGLYFTEETPEQVVQLFGAQEAQDYARTGSRAEMTVVVEADEKGLRNLETDESLPATIETQLRQAGMPTKLHGGTVLLTVSQYTICEAGQRLTADQARLCKAMGIKMASFSVHPIAHLFEGHLEQYEDVKEESDAELENEELENNLENDNAIMEEMEQ